MVYSGQALSWGFNTLFNTNSLNCWIKFNSYLFRVLRVPTRFHGTILNIPKNLSAGPITLRLNNTEFKYYVAETDDLRFRVRNSLEGWESHTREIFKNICQSSKVVVDIGAYTGIYSALALSSKRDARIIAFEPNPDTFQILKKNIESNFWKERSELFEVALSDQDDFATLYSPKKEGGTSMHSLEFQSGAPVATVNVRRLDSLFPSLCVDLIKLDVEGHELKVLLGGESLLKRSNCHVIFETLDSNSLAKITSFILPLGYSQPKKLDSRNYITSSLTLSGDSSF